MTSDNKSNVSFESVLGMTSNIVSSYVSHNALPADQIPELIKTVYTSLDGVQPSTSKTTEQSQKPVV